MEVKKLILASIAVGLLLLGVMTVNAIDYADTPPSAEKSQRITFTSTSTYETLSISEGQLLAYDFTARGGNIRLMNNASTTESYVTINNGDTLWTQLRLAYDKTKEFYFMAETAGITLEAHYWYWSR